MKNRKIKTVHSN